MIEIKSKNYIFTLRKNEAGKFITTAKKADTNGVFSKYLIADCVDPDATRAFGVQTRKIVKTFFEGSMVYDQLIEALKTGVIDKESGASSKPLAGYFVDIDCGFSYKSEFNGRTFTQNTVSLFIMAGENFEVVKNRAIRGVESTRVISTDDHNAAIEQGVSAATNAPAPAAETEEF